MTKYRPGQQPPRDGDQRRGDRRGDSGGRGERGGPGGGSERAPERAGRARDDSRPEERRGAKRDERRTEARGDGGAGRRAGPRRDGERGDREPRGDREARREREPRGDRRPGRGDDRQRGDRDAGGGREARGGGRSGGERFGGDRSGGNRPSGERERPGRGDRAERRPDRDRDRGQGREAGREPGPSHGAGYGRGRDDARAAPRPQSRLVAKPATRREATGAPDSEMRIAKAMARAGLCSRREAERWIEDGRVSVNGEVLRSPARDVGPKDKVLVDGRPLPGAEPTQLWRYYKPRGLVTTHNDPQGRPTVFDELPPELPRVVSVGRLDFNTEGLLLLTNDGALARHLELPATGWLRRYRVRAHGRVTQAELDRLKDGVEVEGVRYGPVEATLDSVQGANVWLTVAIREGKNREVRKILSNFALDVNRLIRVSYGPFQLLELKPGEVEAVRQRTLADQLGAKLAAELHLVDTAEDRKARWSGAKGEARKTAPDKADGGGASDDKAHDEDDA